MWDIYDEMRTTGDAEFGRSSDETILPDRALAGPYKERSFAALLVRISTYDFKTERRTMGGDGKRVPATFGPFPARNAEALITRPNFVQNFTAHLIRKSSRLCS